MHWSMWFKRFVASVVTSSILSAGAAGLPTSMALRTVGAQLKLALEPAKEVDKQCAMQKPLGVEQQINDAILATTDAETKKTASEASIAGAAGQTKAATDSTVVDQNKIASSGVANQQAGLQDQGASQQCIAGMQAVASKGTAALKSATDAKDAITKAAAQPGATQQIKEKAKLCEKAVSQLTQKIEPVTESAKNAATQCGADGQGAAALSGQGFDMGDLAKALAMLGALAGMAAMAAKSSPKSGGEETSTTKSDENTPTTLGVTSTTANPNLVAAANNASPFGGDGTAPNTGSVVAAATPVGVAGNAGDPLGDQFLSGRSTSTTLAGATGTALASGNTPGNLATGSPGIGGAGATGGVGGGDFASGRALAADSGSSSSGGFSGDGGRAAASETLGAVTTSAFIDGTDDKGSYVYKMMGGKRIKVYVDCSTPGRCRVRNEIRERIENNPLLK